MKVDHVIDRDTEISGDTTGIDFEMDTNSMGLIMQGFSDSLYTDKIGSIVREITSNCFDSHEESGVDVPVDITFQGAQLGDQQETISFIDYGTGISPDRMKNIYSKYGASTKRDTNGQIGGWGFGAKVPFAYTNMFEVITRYEGTEYHYVLYKGEKAPRIELIAQQPTEDKNGTEVRIPLKSEGDKIRFENALRTQLTFFDNVNYHNCRLSNDYEIIKGNHFIVNTSSKHINNSGICLGKVFYPFPGSDFDVSIYSPICLYFDIGELTVTWSRESIEDTEANNEAITEKIELARTELRRIQEKSKGKPILNLIEYLKQYKGEYLVNLHNVEVKAKGFVPQLKQDYFYLPDNNYSDDVPEYLFQDFGVWEVGSDGSSTRNDRFRKKRIHPSEISASVNLFEIIDNDRYQIIYADEGERLTKKINSYIIEQFPGKCIAIVKRAQNKSNVYNKGASGSNADYNELRDTVRHYVRRKFPKYADFTPSKEWSKAYNKKVRNSEPTILENDEFLITQINGYGSRSDTFTVNHIKDRTKEGRIIVYGGMKEVDDMREIRNLLTTNYRFGLSERNHSYNVLHSMINFIRVNSKTRKMLSNIKGAYTLPEFFDAYQDKFRHFYFSFKLNELKSRYYNMYDNFIRHFPFEYPLSKVMHKLYNSKCIYFSTKRQEDLIREAFEDVFKDAEHVVGNLCLNQIKRAIEPYHRIPFLSSFEMVNFNRLQEKQLQTIEIIKKFHKDRLVYKNPNFKLIK